MRKRAANKRDNPIGSKKAQDEKKKKKRKEVRGFKLDTNSLWKN